MKKKMFERKLSLNKETVSNLDTPKMEEIKGGVVFPVSVQDCWTRPGEFTCDGYTCYEDPEKKEAEMIEEYRQTFASPYRAAERGFIDEIILPEETRPKLIKALESLKNKKDRMPKKKHDNLPL